MNALFLKDLAEKTHRGFCVVDLATGTMMAGSDPRRTAYAMGY